MMKQVLMGFGLSALISLPSYAVGLDAATLMMTQQQPFASQKMDNTDEKNAHLIQIKVVPVDSPYKLNPIESETKHDVLWTPAQTILPPGKSNVIKIYYQGPKDNKERYYAVQWTDSVVASTKSDAKKGATVLAKATVSTVLVVHPNKIDVTYSYDKKQHRLTNTGNTSIKTVAYGNCIKQTDKNGHKKCQEILFLTPKKSAKYSVIDMGDKYSSLGYWLDNRFISIDIH